MKLIPLNHSQFAKVDDSDFSWLSQWKWRAQYDPTIDGFYATRQFKVDGVWRHASMHRRILGLEYGDKRKADHINHDTLDNQRSNLRIANVFESARNRRSLRATASGLKGVVWDQERSQWISQIRVNGKLIRLGRFHDKNAAHEAYCEAAKINFGEFWIAK